MGLIIAGFTELSWNWCHIEDHFTGDEWILQVSSPDTAPTADKTIPALGSPILFSCNPQSSAFPDACTPVHFPEWRTCAWADVLS